MYNYNELEEIRHEQEAIKAAIPSWERAEYDDIVSNMARQKIKIMFGGEGN